MLIAHFVSAFPVLSETFVQREIQAFAEAGFKNLVIPLRRRPTEAVQMSLAFRERLGIEDILYPGEALTGNVGSMRLPMSGTVSKTLRDAFRHPTEAAACIYTLGRALALSAHLKSRGAVHTHAHFAHYPAMAAWACSRLIGSSFSWNAHSYDLYNYTAGLNRRIVDADAIFPISNLNAEYIRSRVANTPTQNVHVTPCGVDGVLSTVDSTRPIKSPARLISLGRLVDSKGFADLIEAVRLLNQNSEAIHLQIIGEGPERARLEKLIADKKIGNAVELLGALPHPKVLEALAASDLFVMACRVGTTGLDGIPVALMEAMALGLPVVATDFASIPELVEHEITGLLARPADPQQLSEQITSLMENSYLRENVKSAALERIRNDYDAQKNYATKTNIISNLIS